MSSRNHPVREIAESAVSRRRFFTIAMATTAATAAVAHMQGAASAQVGSAAGSEVAPLLPARPKLPQDCTPGETALRKAFLDTEHSIYRWSMQVENVEGVPMLETVPIGENPTIDWLVEFLDNVLDLIDDLLVAAAKKLLPASGVQIDAINGQLQNIKDEFFRVSRQYLELVRKYDSLPVDAVVDAADKVALEVIVKVLLGLLSALQKIRRDLFLGFEEQLKSQHKWIGELSTLEGLEKYDVLWETMPIPDVSEHVHDDEFFGYARVAGPNPMVLTKVSAVPELFELDEQRYGEAAGEELSVSLAEGRLFAIDYASLGSMAKEDATFKLLTGDNYGAAPIALLVLPADDSVLRPVAIQIGQVPGESPVFYRPPEGTTDGKRYWGWEMAKTVVQTADFNHHEMFSHLGETHLVSEGFCMATHRQLPRTHPLRELLEPHFEGDLWVNNIAAAIILGPYSFGDEILPSPIEDAAAGAGRARLDWHFQDKMPHRDFQIRGLDDPRLEHPYRDDALSVWEEIHTWVADYIAVYYSGDDAVLADTELGAWSDEVIENAKINGFVRPTTRDELVETITMVVFTASAQHAAVNYLQRDDMTYVPYYAGTLASLPTDPEGEYTEAQWLDMLPTFLSSLAQMYFLNVLGTVYYRRLGEYKLPVFPHRPALVDERVQDALSQFQARLQLLETEIVQRNTKRRWEYPYLLPSNIPTSTNI